MAGIHDGHRKRLKEQFLKTGLDDFEPHKALELLLFYAVPQKDTNELAHRLINHFGSFSEVLDADFKDLCEVPGIGEHAATLLKLMPDLFRKYQDDYDVKGIEITNLEQIGDFLRPKFIGRTKEMVFLVCLNDIGKIVFADFIVTGTINATPIYTREILEVAIRCKATIAILAHNHPRSLAVPSHADVVSTKAVHDALLAAKIKLVDHFIFSGDEYTSMQTSGYMEY